MGQRDVKLAHGKPPGKMAGLRVRISLRPTQLWDRRLWTADYRGRGQGEMTARKDRKSKTDPQSKQRKSKLAGECAFPDEPERLPPHIPGTYQVAMGTDEEMVAWLRGVPRNARAILIPFSNEASYRVYGPIFWHLAHKLPGIVARIQRRRFERLVDSLTQLLLELPKDVPLVVPGARVIPTKGNLQRRPRGNRKT